MNSYDRRMIAMAFTVIVRITLEVAEKIVKLPPDVYSQGLEVVKLLKEWAVSD